MTAAADIVSIRRALDLLVKPGGIAEIRALKIPGRGKPYQAAGYFRDPNKAAQAAATLDKRKAGGVYIVLNEVDSALLARSPDQATDYLDPLTGDGDILRRRWLPLDFDPTRPAGISASEDEHCAAQDVARQCAAWLSSEGWPMPILADSGNGAHLLYRIDLPNDEASTNLVRDSIAAVAERFAGNGVDVDLKVFNAARIWKVYGTTARKGHSTQERPHRVAQLIDVPAAVEVVTGEKLAVLAATASKPMVPMPSTSHNGDGASFAHRLDVARWLSDRGRAFKFKTDSRGRVLYVLEACPFDSSHGGNGEAVVTQEPGGKLGATCLHNSCSGRGWREFKAKIGPPDPDHYDPPLNGRKKTGKASSKTPDYKPVAPGTRVRALDRDNFGEVVSDNGDTCMVHFVSPEGQPANVNLPKSQLVTEDGTPLEAPEIPPPTSLRELVSSYPNLRPAVIEGLLRIGETMNLIAAPKAKKSWLVSSLALSVPTGRRWLDSFTCNPGRVLIIDGELHPEVIAYRMRAVVEAMGVDPEYLDSVDVLPLRGRGVDLLNLGPFLDTIEPGRYALVVLDAWYRFIPPGVSENDNAQVMALYNKIDTYTERLRAAWLNVHHASKGDQSEKSTTDVGSGAGSQSRAADTHLIIRQHEQDDVAVIEAVVRSWPPVDRLAIRWIYPAWQLDPDADTSKLRRQRGQKVDKEARLEADRKAIVDAMRSHGEPETESFFRGLSKISDYRRWNEAWTSLISDKTITETGERKKNGNGQSYPTWFFAPSEMDQ